MPDKLKSKTSPEFLIISALFVLGFLIRFYHLGTFSLGDDELTTSVRINHSLGETIGLLVHSSFPPLYYASLNLWVNLIGNSEWALRFPSAFFSGLTIIVIYHLGKELFNKEAGMISASLLVFSPFALQQAQFAKMYPLFWLLEAASFLFFLRYLKVPKKSFLVYYVITSILCCYTLLTGFLFLVTQNIIFFLYGNKAWRKIWIIGQLIIFSVFVPWVICFLFSKHEVWGLIRPVAVFDYTGYLIRSFLLIIGSGFEIWTHESWAQYSFKLILWEINCFIYVFVTVFLFFDVLKDSCKNKEEGRVLPLNYFCLLLWIAIPTVLYFIFDYMFIHINLEAKYIGYIQIPLILLVSSRINRSSGAVKKLLLVGLFIISMTNIYLYFREKLEFPQQDWRSTSEELTRYLGKDDIVVSFVNIPDFQYYYKGDTRRFYMVSPKDCTTDFLTRRGIITAKVKSIFILYKNGPPLSMALNGFNLEYKISNGGNGFLHFRRI